MMSDGRYPESRKVQGPAIEWLRANRGYVELFNDIGAVGARMDSAGLMDGRLVIVEVKDGIDARAVRFVPDRPGGTIEAKLSGMLRDVARSSTDALTQTIFDHRPLPNRPVVAILARRYGGGAVDQLGRMLAERAPDWEFDWQIWQWTGEQVETLRSGTGAGPGFPPADRLPVQVPPPGPRTRGSPERMRELADLAGVRDLFEAAVRMAGETGLRRLPPTATNQNFGWKAPDGRILNVFGLYPRDSSGEHGLNVGIWIAGLPWRPTLPPGLAPAPPAGFLNTNLYARSVDDVAALLACFRGPEAATDDGEDS